MFISLREKTHGPIRAHAWNGTWARGPGPATYSVPWEKPPPHARGCCLPRRRRPATYWRRWQAPHSSEHASKVSVSTMAASSLSPTCRASAISHPAGGISRRPPRFSICSGCRLPTPPRFWRGRWTSLGLAAQGLSAACPHRTLLDEHFRVEGRRTWFETLDEMQSVLDQYLVESARIKAAA